MYTGGGTSQNVQLPQLVGYMHVSGWHQKLQPGVDAGGGGEGGGGGEYVGAGAVPPQNVQPPQYMAYMQVGGWHHESHADMGRRTDASAPRDAPLRSTRNAAEQHAMRPYGAP